MTPAAGTGLLDVPGGRLEYLTTGAGEPVTLFVPGLGGGIPDTRPLGGGVPGTKVFLSWHGRSWRYGDLAADLAAAADVFAATRALGVSLGAGALCRLVADDPERFERLVCFLPAVLDVPRGGAARTRLTDLAAAITTGSADAVAEVIAAEVPEPYRDTAEARAFVTQRTTTLLGAGCHAPGDVAVLADAVVSLADEVAVPDAAALRRVTAPTLVLGCRGDDLHPAEVAAQLAAALPHSTLHVYDEPAPLWTHRADLRNRISGFLS